MALLVLTNQQKEELRNYADFKEECKWGLLNKAAYWKGQDGSTPPGGDRIKWSKSRSYAAQLQLNPGQVNPDSNSLVVDRFLVYIKNIACVSDQGFVIADVVAYLLANNHFDAMGDQWFDDQISTVPF